VLPSSCWLQGFHNLKPSKHKTQEASHFFRSKQHTMPSQLQELFDETPDQHFRSPTRTTSSKSKGSVERRGSDGFSPTPIGRCKSALGRMQMIKESKLRRPILSPVSLNTIDVFGESISCVDVWEEQDKFTPPIKRRSSGSRRVNTKDRMKGLKENCKDLDLDF
jgi:hypothetical protein